MEHTHPRTKPYRQGSPEAIATLKTRIAEEIQKNGPIGFDRFMAMALYDPKAGYYASSSRQVGRDGDFFTSVSAGPLFGQLIALHLKQAWTELGRPRSWRILELGAHNGLLAEDIIVALPSDIGAEYVILEPLDELATAQKERLGDQVQIVKSLDGLPAMPGILIANEVLDALPFHIVESTGENWVEIGVGLNSTGEFEYEELGAATDIAANLPLRAKGYRTEVRPYLAEFLKPLANTVTPGRMLWFDYGFERDDYYDESRTTGTLRTFHKHKAGENPLEHPGLLDITAHVDFTAMRDAIQSLGGSVLRFENQARFLTSTAKPLLLSLEGKTDPETLKLVRNFQTLTHPGQLGSRFHVMEAQFE